MARGQGEVKGITSHCAICSRQSSNTDTDLTSCEVRFDACHSFLRSSQRVRLAGGSASDSTTRDIPGLLSTGLRSSVSSQR
ncbi:MAG: hypothetical protein JRG73_03650 [Deltaproteobacteria bacterium]|nr:hypothetical protein [Deltaproteobacteria bacterium]